MTSIDPFNLERFAGVQLLVFETVLKELHACKKRTHWIWFVFPQIRGLGHSSMAQFYGITALDEAKAYLAHHSLGPRLIQCTETVLNCKESLHTIFGSPDDMKFRSCMTLFAMVSNNDVFQRALDQLCEGKKDVHTLELV